MRFTIMDVGHGFCAYLIADNGNSMVFDCGHSSDPLNRPSDHLYDIGQRSIDRLFITNYDEDHISDLPNIQRKLRVEVLHRNDSITPDQLRRLKRQSGPISDAMQTLLDMLNRYTGGVPNPPELPDIEWSCFCNNYIDDFEDTNNISLVTFLNCKGLRVLIPGDVETAGWLKLIQNVSFRLKLGEVDVFIAPHHGRETGYCEEVFNYCSPDVIVFSDGPKKYATQEMTDKYAKHAQGINFNGQTRYVLTTRNDGSFCWDI